MQKIITIIGGQGQMGRLFSFYWQQLGYTVKSLDINDWNDAENLISYSDLVVVCVPIHETIPTINKLIPYLSPTSILADFTSIKTLPLNVMLQGYKGNVLGLHPMFGPTITSPKNQVIINCNGRGNNQWVLDSLIKIGFTITDMDAAKHDQAMSFIQGIEHFSTFVLGSFLKQHNQHPNDLFNLASPIYQAKLALMGRIFDQDASLYADIVTADKNRIELIDQYAKFFQQWIDELKLGNKSKFIADFNQTKKWMGDFTHMSQLASDQFLTAVCESFPKKDLNGTKME